MMAIDTWKVTPVGKTQKYCDCVSKNEQKKKKSSGHMPNKIKKIYCANMKWSQNF